VIAYAMQSVLLQRLCRYGCGMLNPAILKPEHPSGILKQPFRLRGVHIVGNMGLHRNCSLLVWISLLLVRVATALKRQFRLRGVHIFEH
jgi:hypothetical protein